MTRILTVDDSRAIRSIVVKQCTEMGIDCDEAENGEAGLAQLEECHYELIVLDVTMPVLDGPGMLKKMRELGNQTPVLMLTSESKRTTVAEVMKLGIGDYILKPFKPEELRAKIAKIIGGGSAAVSAPAAAAAAPPPAAVAPGGGHQFVDVLLVDDMENVHKKLRSLLPQHVTFNATVSAQAAIQYAHERIYRLIVIDTDIPDVNSAVLMGQLKALQPSAAFYALALRSTNDVSAEVRSQGFEGLVLKPFDAGSVDDLVMRYFDNQEALRVEENVLKASSYGGKSDAAERYYQRLTKLVGEAVDKVAAACYDEAILELSDSPAHRGLMPRFVIEADARTKAAGVSLRVVGTPECAAVLKEFADTAKIPFFSTLEAARAGG